MDVSSIVSLTISGVTLLALLTAVIYYERQARAAAQAQFQQSFITISNAFLAYPQLRPLFYAGATPDSFSEDDVHRAETIAELLLDIFDLVIELEKRFKTRELAAGWRPYMDQMLQSSDVLRSQLGLRRDWYPSLADKYLDAPTSSHPDRS